MRSWKICASLIKSVCIWHIMNVTEMVECRRKYLKSAICHLIHVHGFLVFSFAVVHYSIVIMSTMASQITSLTIVYSTVYSSADQRKHQSSASLAFVRGIHRRPVNSQHKGPVTRKMFPFDDVIMCITNSQFMSYIYRHSMGVVSLPHCKWSNPEGWKIWVKVTSI